MAQIPLEIQQRALKLFEQVVELGSPERQDFLERHARESQVRRLVDSLLAQDLRSGVIDGLAEIACHAARASLSLRARHAVIVQDRSTEPSTPFHETLVVGDSTCTCGELLTRIRELQLLGDKRLAKTVQAVSDRETQPGRFLIERLLQLSWLTTRQAVELSGPNWQRLRLGKYVILRELGRGGMGVVYQARHTIMQSDVALKVMSPAFAQDPSRVERFRQEVIAAAKLKHPNIVAASDADVAGSSLFLAMEYIVGDDLAAIVRERGPLEIPEAIECVLDAARGLAYAHQKGVIHRDIKPSNLLLSKDGEIKILDMGLARVLESEWDETRSRLTTDGTVMGTVDFMAPEQAIDSKLADARSDIYSLGMTLFWLLTGRPAFLGDSLTARLVAHREQPLPSLTAMRADVPPTLAKLFERMCAKRPEDRCQSMADVIQTLTAWETADQPTEPALRALPPAPQRASSGKPTQQKRQPVAQSWKWILPVSILVVSAIGGVAWWCQKPPQVGAAPEPQPVADVGPGTSAATAPPPGHPSPTKDPAPAALTSPNLALMFDGIDDHVRLPIGADAQNPLTIEVWATPLLRRDYAATLVSNTEDGGFKIEWLRSNDRDIPHRDRYCFTTYDRDVVEKIRVPSDQSVEVGRRVHIAAVWQQNSARLFIDGKLQSQGRVVRNPIASPLKFFVGGNPTYADGSARAYSDFGFLGLLDEIRLSLTARYGDDDFSPPERFQSDPMTLGLYHCDEQDGDRLIDASANHADGKIFGAAYVDEAAQAELLRLALPEELPLRTSLSGDAGCLEFTGQTSVAAPLELDQDQPFTIEAWVQPIGPRGELVNKPFVVADGFCHLKVRWEEPLRWNFGVDAETAAKYPSIDMGGSLRENHISHVAGVFDGRQLRLYQDGRIAGHRDIDFIRNPKPDNRGKLVIGTWTPGAPEHFRGRLYAFRISSAVRYAGLFYAPPEHLAADAETLVLYQCDERSGNVLTDSSGHARDGTIVNPAWP